MREVVALKTDLHIIELGQKVSEYQSVSCSLKYRGITDELYFLNGYYKSLDFSFIYFLGYERYRTENQGRFPFNQTEANGTETSRKVSRNSGNC